MTYWLASDRRIVLLTVFRKTRDRESAEVARAQAALRTCQTENHQMHDAYTRDVAEGELE